jgi:hypothetical protein
MLIHCCILLDFLCERSCLFPYLILGVILVFSVELFTNFVAVYLVLAMNKVNANIPACDATLDRSHT